jgi:hypothetical protein
MWKMTKEMQLEVTIRYHKIPIRMVIMKKMMASLKNCSKYLKKINTNPLQTLQKKGQKGKHTFQLIS